MAFPSGQRQASCVQNFLEAEKIKLLRHAPHSLDLAPGDIWLFSQLKMRLTGKKFNSEQEQGYCQTFTEGGILHVFEKWHERLLKCIEVCVGGGG